MASITCGNCTQTHQSVAQVRDCHSRQRSDLRNLTSPGVWKQDERNAQEKACDEQMAEQRADLAHHVATDPAWRQPVVRTGGRSFGRVQEIMRSVALMVPEGRYALVIAGSTSFYHVQKPTEGRWAGCIFVKVQASDDTYPLKGESGLEVIRQIAVDPQEAMLRYGREIGKCGHCGRTLTNEESRTAGIGPICRSKVGFAA